jgi:hypothetical protein
MSNKTRNELMALAAEFAEQRQSGNKRRFPETLWKQAVALAQQYSVDEVGQAIKVPSAYLTRVLDKKSPKGLNCKSLGHRPR